MEYNNSCFNNKPVFHDSLVRELEKLEYSLTILDTHFGSKEFGHADILAVDETGRIVIINVYSDETVFDLIEIADRFKFVSGILDGLCSLYPDCEINTDVLPATIVLSTGFSVKFLRNLSLLNLPKIELIRLEYVLDRGQKKLKLNKVSGKESKITDQNSPKVGVDELKRKLKELAYDVTDMEIDTFLKFYE